MRAPAALVGSAVAALLLTLVPATASEPSDDGAPLFEDASASFGLEGVTSPRVAFADVDADGWPDALIGRTQIHRNEAGRRFARSPGDAVLVPEGVRGATVVAVGDLNGDGLPDVYLGRNTDLSNDKFEDDGLRSEVWLADGRGSFAKVERSGVGAHAETTIAACVLDYDRDGNLDIFVGNAYTAYGKSLEAFPDRLYRGRGDGTFDDVTEAAGLLGVAEPGRPDSRKPTYGVTHADWNGDGWQDLLVMTYGRQWNRLWRNDGDGTFTDVAAETGFDGDAIRHGEYPERVGRRNEAPFRANGNTFDAAVADFDGDGDLDCFLGEITHWWAGTSSDLSMLLVNRGAVHGFAFRRDPERITRTHAVAGWNQGDLHAGWLDVDNDGFLDLLIASSDYPDDQLLRIWHQRPDDSGAFDEWTDRLGFRWMNASQIALADVDRDGATDILVGTSNMRLTKEQREGRSLEVGLFRNLAATRAGNRFLSIRLAGAAIGASVSIEVGDRQQLRIVQGGSGHSGHRDDEECRFGLGSARTVDRLVVRWPDAAGTVQTFDDVPSNHFYRLSRGGALECLGPY